MIIKHNQQLYMIGIKYNYLLFRLILILLSISQFTYQWRQYDKYKDIVAQFMISTITKIISQKHNSFLLSAYFYAKTQMIAKANNQFSNTKKSIGTYPSASNCLKIKYCMSIVQKQPPEHLKHLTPAKPSFQKQKLQPKRQKKPLSPLQIIFKALNELRQKNQDVTNADLQKSYRLIQNSKTLLSSNQIISCVKYLMSVLYKKNYPKQQLLYNPMIKKLEKYQKFIQLQNILYVINRELALIQGSRQVGTDASTYPNKQQKQNSSQSAKGNQGQKGDINLVNNLYLYCLQKLIPSFDLDITNTNKQQIEHERNKSEAILYKNFGKYMIQYGGPQNRSKGSSTINRSIYKHQQLITQQYRKLQLFIKSTKQEPKFDPNKQQAPKSKLEKQKQQMQINAIKQNIRRLIQSMFETLHYFYIIKKNQIKPLSASPLSQKQQKKAEDAIVQILTVINSTIKFKSMVPGIQNYSRHYHRLMQIFYQLEYTYALMKKNVQKVKEIRTLMKQFIKESMYDIQQCQRLQIQKQIALSIFSIQLHLSKSHLANKNRTKAQIDEVNQQLKRDLSDCALKIIKAGKMEQKNIAKEVITKLLGDFIKKNIH